MVAIYEATEPRNLPIEARCVDGARWLIRGAQRFFGTVFVLAAFGLWLQPNALFDADLLLFKLGMSCAFGLAGLGLLHSGKTRRTVEVEIDHRRGVVRLVRGRDHTAELVQAVRFADLGSAELHGDLVRMWCAQGDLLAEVALSDPEMRRTLIAALTQAGKL